MAFYRGLCEALLEVGITPVVTLYHWDLPLALHRRGGWTDRRSVDWFTEYAVTVKERLGDLVSLWTTLNEPWSAAFLGYGSGVHAPGVADPASAYLAGHHLILARHSAVRAMRGVAARPDDRLGVVLNLIPAWPSTPSAEDVRVAELVDAIGNRQFLDGALDGTYPSEIRDMHERFGVADQIDLAELAAMRADIDVLGVNYYNVNHIAHVAGTPSPGEFPGADGAVVARPPGDLTEMGWGVEPEGLTWMLRRVAAAHPGLPMFVFENGAAYRDERRVDGEIDDADRIEYVRRHLAALGDAVDAGVDVRGYFLWSLLDNFEWSLGYSMRFGVVEVDPVTGDRTVKRSWRWYRDFLRDQTPSSHPAAR